MTNTRRIQIDNYDTAPEWAQALDGTPATADQIEASEEAEQGLIRIDVDGNVIKPGAFCTSDTVAIWVD